MDKKAGKRLSEKKIVLNLPEEIFAELTDIAIKNFTTRAGIIRGLIVNFLKEIREENKDIS